ncbi:SPW repeat-containing protein [Sinosporangium album]|uniref:SPW repeat-containing protein n=1 Tax=Sinosporangium album TaxID=504805 RepID=A0A1G8B6X4_9ACTN|nr:SPW repeat protein [Sinosporangium album]SDH28928.1 SPW repeat-containing protein [Sinosporangium album]
MAGQAMSTHPDIAELRAKYELAGEAPTAKVVAGLIFLTGLYIAASPWIVGFNGFTTLAVNNLIVGIALALLGFGFVSAYGRTHGVAWVVPIIGLWTIVAPWVVHPHVAPGSMIWSNVASGIVALALGLGAVFLGRKVETARKG